MREMCAVCVSVVAAAIVAMSGSGGRCRIVEEILRSPAARGSHSDSIDSQKSLRHVR